MFENVKEFIEEMDVIENKMTETLEQLTDDEDIFFEYQSLYLAKAIMCDIGNENSVKLAKIILAAIEG